MRAFAIGSDFTGSMAGVELLAQWNYWCEYMNRGPAELSLPSLFLSERENLREGFAMSRGHRKQMAITFITILGLPFLLTDLVPRRLALWTCRNPVWPMAVEAVSDVGAADPFDQPRGDTPVGWADTAIARAMRKWPTVPTRKVAHWMGEPDAAKNAQLWLQDIPSPSTQDGGGAPKVFEIDRISRP